MSTEARDKAYTPTTEQVREQYTVFRGTRPVANAEFDRWLAEYDAEVRASVLSGLTVERIAEVAEEAHRQLARDGLHAEYGPGSLHEAIGIAVLALIEQEVNRGE